MFSKGHRRQLGRLGLSQSQIAALEKRALPRIASAATWPRLAEVRAPLDEVASLARDLATRIERLQTAPDGGSLAWNLLDEAHHGRLADDHLANPRAPYPDDPSPEELAKALRRLAGLAEGAKAQLKGRQGRNKTAAPYPIGVIEDVMLDAWTRENEDPAGIRPLPEYPIHVSSSPESAFRRIVGICYEAAGHPTPDPERAIKAYIAAERKREAWLEELLGNEPMTPSPGRRKARLR